MRSLRYCHGAGSRSSIKTTSVENDEATLGGVAVRVLLSFAGLKKRSRRGLHPSAVLDPFIDRLAEMEPFEDSESPFSAALGKLV